MTSSKNYFHLSDRIKNLPPYLFAEMDRLREETEASGIKVIDLSIGDPVEPTPVRIISKLIEAAQKPENHRYSDYPGRKDFRVSVANWMRERFGVALDPEKEIACLIGAKEGIAHFPLAFVDPGDYVLVPDPGYPVYKSASIFAGANIYTIPLLRENKFLPDLSQIPSQIISKAVLIFLNYPNNPTSVVANKKFFTELVAFALKHNLIICHDAAYTEIYFNEEKPPSLLEIPEAKEVTLEIHSLSKSFNMTGWRLGFAAGNEKLLAGLMKVKMNIDSSVFGAIQEAGAQALASEASATAQMRQIYKKRRDLVLNAFHKMGWKSETPEATPYLWLPLPDDQNSREFALEILSKTGVVVTPGTGFGSYGEGYIRISLTISDDLLIQALDRIGNYFKEK